MSVIAARLNGLHLSLATSFLWFSTWHASALHCYRLSIIYETNHVMTGLLFARSIASNFMSAIHPSQPSLEKLRVKIENPAQQVVGKNSTNN